MKVILQADVKKLGAKGEVVEVSDGYGRNYLLPRKLAIEAKCIKPFPLPKPLDIYRCGSPGRSDCRPSIKTSSSSKVSSPLTVL